MLMVNLVIPMFSSANSLWQRFVIDYSITDSKLEKNKMVVYEVQSFFSNNIEKAFATIPESISKYITVVAIENPKCLNKWNISSNKIEPINRKISMLNQETRESIANSYKHYFQIWYFT